MKRCVIFALNLLLAVILLSCNNDSGTTIQLVPPTISAVSPNRVSRADNVVGTITGTKFTGATSVSFGSEIGIERFSVLNDSTIEVQFRVNANAAAVDHNVTVTTPAGTGTAPNLLKVIDNRAPFAKIQSAPLKGATNTDFTFDGQASTDQDGKVVSYSWDFGDGKTKIGPVVSHTFATKGTYEVTLKVFDNDEATGEATASVEVIAGIAPTAEYVVSPKQGDVLTVYKFDASRSVDPDGRIVKYEWDFNDGTKAQGVSVDKNYPKSGIYDVLLIVTDNKGLQSTSHRDVTVGAFDAAKATQEIRSVTDGFFRRYSNLHGYSTDEILVDWSYSCPGRDHEATIIDKQKQTIEKTSAIPTSPADVSFVSTTKAHAVAPAHFTWTNFDGTGGDAIATHDFLMVYESDGWYICNFTVF